MLQTTTLKRNLVLEIREARKKVGIMLLFFKIQSESVQESTNHIFLALLQNQIDSKFLVDVLVINMLVAVSCSLPFQYLILFFVLQIPAGFSRCTSLCRRPSQPARQQTKPAHGAWHTTH
jgi:hypothetical protein